MKSLLKAIALSTGMLVLGTTAVVAEGTAEQKEKTFTVDLDAQPLSDALWRFALQTNIQLAFFSQIDAQYKAEPLKGEFTVDDGLKQLLKGTPLAYKRVNDRTVSIGLADEIRDGATDSKLTTSYNLADSELRLADAMMAGQDEDTAKGQASESSEVENTNKSADESANSMVVTGTQIRGGRPIGSPITVYTREEIEKSGQMRIVDFFSKQVLQNFGGGVTEDFRMNSFAAFYGNATERAAAGSADGTAGTSLNLRGLGPGTTLVLMNGHRIPAGGAGNYVDVSMIPLSAVERIEVMTDGASSMYGSDAVGGVVNLIMRKEYQGGMTSLRGGTTTQGGGDEFQVSQTFGTGWSSGNLVLSLEHYGRGTINVTQRKVFQFDRATIPAQNLLGNQDMDSAFLSFNQALSQKVSLSGEVFYSNRKNTDSSVVQYAVPPYTNNSTADSGQYGAAASLSVPLLSSWETRITGTAGRNTSDVFLTNVFSNIRDIRQYDLRTIDAVASGPLFSLPSGTVSAAIGAGYREEKQEGTSSIDGTSPFAYSGNGKGLDANAIFMELMLPIVKGTAANPSTPKLGMSVSGRRDDYERYGAASTYKVGVQWRAAPFLQFRSSYGSAFKAPNLAQGDTSLNSLFFSDVTDLQFPGGSRRVIQYLGVDESLGPETSKTWTVGFDLSLEALGGLTAEVNYYDIRYKDRIQSINIGTIDVLYVPAYADIRVLRSDTTDANFNALVQSILDGAGGGRSFGCNDNYSAIVAPCTEPASNFDSIVYKGTRNIALMRVSGVDFSLNLPLSFRDNKFNVGTSLAYYSHSIQQFTATAVPIDNANRAFNPRHVNARVFTEWMRGSFGAIGAVNYGGKYRSYTLEPLGRIPSNTTFDLNLRYDTAQRLRNSWLSNVRISLNVDNVFDKDPPTFVRYVTPTSFYTWYDGANFDPYGRAISLTLSKSW